jgi:hypothetical protein
MKENFDKNREKERLVLTIQRLDHYYGSVNNKSAVYIAINTFLTGGIIAMISNPEIIENLWQFATVTTGLCLLTGIGNLILLAITSRPFFSTKPESLYYFGSISSKTSKEFARASKNCDHKQELKDLRSQVYILSQGLTKKFEKLKLVGHTLVVQFFLLIPLMFFLTINL